MSLPRPTHKPTLSTQWSQLHTHFQERLVEFPRLVRVIRQLDLNQIDPVVRRLQDPLEHRPKIGMDQYVTVVRDDERVSVHPELKQRTLSRGSERHVSHSPSAASSAAVCTGWGRPFRRPRASWLPLTTTQDEFRLLPRNGRAFLSTVFLARLFYVSMLSAVL